jgi:site-specific DNA recombinase
MRTRGRTNDERNAYYRCAGAMNIPRQGLGTGVLEQGGAHGPDGYGGLKGESADCLPHPERLEQEYRQRLHPQQPDEHEGLEAQMGKLRRGIARLIDSYAEGLISKEEFEPRVTRMRERMQHLEDQLHRLKQEAEVEAELRLVLGRLETFAAHVQAGLDQADLGDTAGNHADAGQTGRGG